MKDVSIMIDNVKFNYRVGLLIQRNDDVFIEVNPDIDFVTLPGGRVKTLESSLEGLKREIKEEMGIELKDNEVNIRAIVENFFEFDNIKYHEIYILYKIKVKDEDDRFKEGMKNIDSLNHFYKWVNKNKLSDVNLLPEVLRNITDSDQFETIVLNELK